MAAQMRPLYLRSMIPRLLCSANGKGNLGNAAHLAEPTQGYIHTYMGLGIPIISSMFYTTRLWYQARKIQLLCFQEQEKLRGRCIERVTGAVSLEEESDANNKAILCSIHCGDLRFFSRGPTETGSRCSGSSTLCQLLYAQIWASLSCFPCLPTAHLTRVRGHA